MWIYIVGGKIRHNWRFRKWAMQAYSRVTHKFSNYNKLSKSLTCSSHSDSLILLLMNQSQVTLKLHCFSKFSSLKFRPLPPPPPIPQEFILLKWSLYQECAVIKETYFITWETCTSIKRQLTRGGGGSEGGYIITTSNNSWQWLKCWTCWVKTPSYNIPFIMESVLNKPTLFFGQIDEKNSLNHIRR